MLLHNSGNTMDGALNEIGFESQSLKQRLHTSKKKKKWKKSILH